MHISNLASASPPGYHVPRVPQCLSPRRKWDPLPPLPQASVPLPPPRNRGGGHTRLRMRGVGESQFGRLEKQPALCLLCVHGITRQNVRYTTILSPTPFVSGCKPYYRTIYIPTITYGTLLKTDILLLYITLTICEIQHIISCDQIFPNVTYEWVLLLQT